VTRVEKPKPWMMMVPKLEIPPLGILPVILKSGGIPSECSQIRVNIHTAPRIKKK
jgi:hypothetical protein